MDERIKRRRQEEEVLKTPNWLELNPDLLRCIYKRLSFISLNRGKLVCSSWYYASIGCVPNQNQIPWLIFFPPKALQNYGSRCGSRCEFFVPEDKEKVYRSRDLGPDFAHDDCLMTCGSWLLLLNALQNLYILNSLTGERIDLPSIQSFGKLLFGLRYHKVCFWIDNATKDYLVVTKWYEKYTKKGYNNWHDFDCFRCEDVFYNDKNQRLYIHVNIWDINILDFSGDNPRKDRTLTLPYLKLQDFGSSRTNVLTHHLKSRMVVTVSGDLLMVYGKKQLKTWYFIIYKMNQVDEKWVHIDSLGDESLIYDLGITVIANDSIPGIKRNSIYFSVEDYYFTRNKPHNIFVYDLTTKQKELLPQCSLSSMLSFSTARWFFPC